MDENLKEKLNSTIFIGMNIPTQISNLIKSRDNEIAKGMFPCELQAYKFGVNTCISLLKQLLETDSKNEFVVQIENIGDKLEELAFKDLIY